MSPARSVVAFVALLIGLLTGAVCTHTAYWLDSCVAGESGGYGMSPDWVNRCRK